MVVLKPLRLVLTNWPADRVEVRRAPNFPKQDERGFHDIPLSKIIYIDHSDFQPDNKDPNYYGLGVGKEVHLKYAYNIKCTGFKRGADGEASEVEATVDFDSKELPKGKLCWVAEPKPGVAPLSIECRLYSRLFKSAVPPKEYLTDLNPTSLIVVKAFADPSLATAVPCMSLSHHLYSQ
jgi:glutaminyl-tRNA synthetase